jgi:hypothetical protein
MNEGLESNGRRALVAGGTSCQGFPTSLDAEVVFRSCAFNVGCISAARGEEWFVLSREGFHAVETGGTL